MAVIFTVKIGRETNASALLRKRLQKLAVPASRSQNVTLKRRTQSGQLGLTHRRPSVSTGTAARAPRAGSRNSDRFFAALRVPRIPAAHLSVVRETAAARFAAKPRSATRHARVPARSDIGVPAR